MKSEQLINELANLKREIERLNETVLNIRYDDFKSTFIEQIRDTLRKESEKLLETEMCRFDSSSSCTKKGECIGKIQEVMEDVIRLFSQDETDTALILLKELEDTISGSRSPCLDPKCSKFVLEVLQKIRCHMLIFDTFKFRFKADKPENRKFSPSVSMDFSPEQAEKLLSPLSNAWRIQILRYLSSGERSFSEISRELGLRTGHLQFHLRLLKNAGFIEVDRKTHMYSLKRKGIAALRGIGQLIEIANIGESCAEVDAKQNIFKGDMQATIDGK
ncbi:MAG: winged helix-turn-helix domain-containing protein [Methanomassiliicoccales archaeon]